MPQAYRKRRAFSFARPVRHFQRIIARLSSGERRSIAQLTVGSRVTRQAITKHLRVLQKAGMVHSVRTGRESLFRFDPEPLREMHLYLDSVSMQWDHALARLRALVEE